MTIKVNKEFIIVAILTLLLGNLIYWWGYYAQSNFDLGSRINYLEAKYEDLDSRISWFEEGE